MDLPMELKVGESTCVVEAVVGHPLPILRCLGWIDADRDPALALNLRSGTTLAPHAAYRFLRPDVVAAGATKCAFPGFVSEFLLTAADPPESISIGGHEIAVPSPELYSTVNPDFGHLFNTEEVVGRDGIYSQGAPTGINHEIRSFSALARGRTLDFGCGNGCMVSELRARGLDAHGIELNSERIRRSLPADVREFITLYDGARELPFQRGEFDSIFTSEVIEHIIGVDAYIPEFHRILKPGGIVVMTTPDISCIPSSFLTNTVPWHILESTHFNFFNAKSLSKLFGTHFEMERFYRFGQNWVNGTYVPGSIGFVARRRDTPDPGSH